MADRRTGKRVKFERETPKQVAQLDDLFQVFYEARIAEGVSKRTLETYRENYKFFCDYLDRNEIPHDVGKIKTNVLRSYQTWLLTEKQRFEGHNHKTEKEKTVGLSPVTVNTRTKTLRAMFRFLLLEGYNDTDPWQMIKKVEEPQTEIKIMSVEQLKQILNVVNQRSYAGFRDFVLINVLIDGFLRINEATSLKISDIDFGMEMISVRAEIAKTRKSRFVPLNKNTLKLLQELIQESRDFGSPYVFLMNYGEQLNANQFRHRLKEHARNAGINIRVHPHLFRHTAATIFLEQGGEVRHLAKILGHADLRMVMRYTHLSNKSVKNQHEQFSPINSVIGKLNKVRKMQM